MIRRFLVLCCFILIGIQLPAQNPYPVLFKSLPPPITRLYYLEEIGLIGVANHQEIQLWDVKSRAYYGVISVAPPEFSNCHITQVEYVPATNRIAVVFENITLDPLTKAPIYTDYFYLFDAVTLVPDASNRNTGWGMAQLLRYRYAAKAILPALNNEGAIYRYSYDPASERLLTIDRAGDVQVYTKTKWERVIHTGMRETPLLYAAKDGKTFFVADATTGRLKEFNQSDGKAVFSLDLQFIPNNAARYNYYGADKQLSVTAMPSEQMICILDSTNRLRILDTKTSEVYNYQFPAAYGQTLISIVPNWTDSSVCAIAEDQAPPYTRLSFYTNLKTGITNRFTGGTAAYISAASATGLSSKFRMVISGLNEIEVDLANLTEKRLSQFPTTYNELFLLNGNWEEGYFQFVQQASGTTELRVYKKDSLNSALMYRQQVRLDPRESLSAIFPLKKWYITSRIKEVATGERDLHFYDSNGTRLKTIATGIPLQTFDASQTRDQYLFSPDGNYFLLKEIINQVLPMDSCRLRVFRTSDLASVIDLRYTELSDFNPYNHTTAGFAGKVKGFYYIHTEKNLIGVFTNTLVHYSLEGSRPVKQYETKLCLDQACTIGSTVRHMRMSQDGRIMLWSGFVASDSRLNREAYQYVIFTEAATGKHFSGTNLQAFPEVMSVLPFQQYIGLRYLDRIDFLQLASGVSGPFLTINPYVNDNNYDLSFVYTSLDYTTRDWNYYERTNNDDCISFRVGANSFRRRQFDVTYNRPDLVLSRVPGYDTMFRQLYFKAVAKRAERMPNRLKSYKPAEMPQLTLQRTGYEPQGDFLIDIGVKTPSAIDRLVITINGNRVEEKVTIPATGDSIRHWSLRERLTNGENLIEITALTATGIESLPLRLSQSHSRTSDKPNLYVLAASVSRYQPDFNELPFAVKDGRDMAQLFDRFRNDTLYNRITIDTMFNESVSKTTILNWIRAKKALAPADHVLVFYSGHGFLNNELDLCLATSQTTAKDAAASSIDYQSILDEMDALPARQKLLLIDACHSGDFDRAAIEKVKGTAAGGEGTSKGLIGQNVASTDNSFAIMQDLFSFSEPGKGTVVISAAGGTQSAFEAAKYQNGYFTYAFKEALLENKASEDPYRRIWLHQVIRYVKQRVIEMSGGKQQPNLRISNPDLDWRIK